MKNSITILNEYAKKNNCKIEYNFLHTEDKLLFVCNCDIYKENTGETLNSHGVSCNSKKESKEFSAKNMLIILNDGYINNHDLNEDLKTLGIDVAPINLNQLNKNYIKKLEEVNKAYQNIKENL